MRGDRVGGNLGQRRRWTQWVAALVANAYIPGFYLGALYRGPLKAACIPVLNCYSCPGAIFSCPIGAAQNAVVRGYFPFYAVGFLAAVGAMVGRLPCGWLCPFGLFQDLIGGRADRRRRPLPRPVAWGKYAVLALLLPVAALPSGPLDIGYERFCTYLCPSGTLGGSIPLLIADPTLRTLMGPLLAWRVLLLLGVVVLGAAFFYRPFCRSLCPLGAGLGLLNGSSVFGIRARPGNCTDCGACARACPVNLDPIDGGTRSGECIRCLRCVAACGTGALEFGRHAMRAGGDSR